MSLSAVCGTLRGVALKYLAYVEKVTKNRNIIRVITRIANIVTECSHAVRGMASTNKVRRFWGSACDMRYPVNDPSCRMSNSGGAVALCKVIYAPELEKKPHESGESTNAKCMAQLGILPAAIDCHNKEDLRSVQLVLYLYLSRAERKHYGG